MPDEMFLRIHKKIAFGSVAFIIGLTLLINQKYLQFNNVRYSVDISCYYIDTGDVLPSAEDPSFSPQSNSIFFHETSCKGGLNPRQACAVESAARAHPNRQIYILFSSPVTDSIHLNTSLKVLQQFDNIKFARVHINAYSKGTPVENLIAEDLLKSMYRVEHTSDVLRYLTLQKWGGVYLDTDVLVVRPLDTLGTNWAARESDRLVNVAVLAISKDEVGRKLVDAVLRELTTSFRPDLWTYNGPGSLNRVLTKMCSTTEVVEWSAETCNGFKVYNPELIYPVYYLNKNVYFEAGNLENVTKAYTHHFWNKLTYNMTAAKGSPFVKLAKIYCPTTYGLFKEDFGS